MTVANVGGSPSSGTVTVTETPPTGLTITALAGAGWTCTIPTCTRSDALAPATSYPDITVTASVGANVAPGTVTNTAVVSGGGDTNSANNTATDPTVITAPVSGSDLTIAKVHSPSSAAPGHTVTYTVTVGNVGASPSSGTVTVTETPQTGLTITDLSGAGWTCVLATLTCLRGDALAPATSYPGITVTASVDPVVAPGRLTNIVIVSGGGDTNTGNNTASDPTTITAPVSGSDLTIAKVHSPSTAVPGQTITYTVTVKNVGASASSGPVTVTETPPTGLTITALAGAGWTCTIPTCTRSDALAPAASYPDITVTASVGANVAPGTVTNTAVVSGGGDSNTANNTASDPTVITAPVSGSDLTIAKVHSPSTAVPGQTVTYTVTVKNVGASASSGTVTVTETPPTGLTITALSGAGWTCTVPTCTRSDALAPAASYPGITVTTSVGASVAGGTVTNIAVVSGGGDSNPGNNTASDPTTITAPGPVSGSDLTIRKFHSPSTAVPGQTITYTVTVANVGTSASSGTVTVTETPPAGLTITALSGTGWTCTVQHGTCTRSDVLAPATSYPEITVTTIVGATVAAGTVTNIADRHQAAATRTPRQQHGDHDVTTITTPGRGTRSRHQVATPTSPALAGIVHDWLDECAARDRACGVACTSFFARAKGNPHFLVDADQVGRVPGRRRSAWSRLEHFPAAAADQHAERAAVAVSHEIVRDDRQLERLKTQLMFARRQAHGHRIRVAFDGDREHLE